MEIFKGNWQVWQAPKPNADPPEFQFGFHVLPLTNIYALNVVNVVKNPFSPERATLTQANSTEGPNRLPNLFFFHI